MSKASKIIAVFVMATILAPAVMAQENRDLWPLSTFIQSAKIAYKHEYKKTKLKEDLYKSIDLMRDAAGRFQHAPEVYFMLGTFFAEIHALDTMNAYFDSTLIYCDDPTLDKKYLKRCEKENYAKQISKFRQQYWEESYNQAVEYLSQYDTVMAMSERTAVDDSAQIYDSLQNMAFDLSLKNFEQAAMLKRDDPRSYDGIGILYQREKDYAKAVEYYKKALEVTGGEDAESISKIAYAYISVPDWEKSIEWFEKYLEHEPKNTSALINLSVAWASLDDFDKSYEYNQKLLELEPQNTQALFNSGQYWFLQMQETADEMSEYPDSIPANQAKRDEIQKNVDDCRDKAAIYFERILENDPGDVDALKRVGILYLLGNKKEEAAAAFAKIVEVTPDDTDALDYLGRTYIQLEEFKLAIEPYEKLAENDPGNIDVWERLSELYRFTDQPDKAAAAEARAEELKKL